MKVRFPFTALGMSIMLISTLTVNSQSTRENLGLYGGTVLSYAYDEVNDKVFAAVAGPLSLFTSSDSCKTWEQSFPDDSLEIEVDPNNKKGWGGRGIYVVSDGGITVALTSEEGGTMHSCVISTDGEYWHTLYDDYIAREVQQQYEAATGKELKNHGCIQTASVYGGKIYLASNDIILISADTGKTWDVGGFPDSSVLALDTDSSYTVASISPIDKTGDSFYLIASKVGASNPDAGKVYKTTDGITFTEVMVYDTTAEGDTIPVETISALWISKTMPDTIFAYNPGPERPTSIYRSLDGGLSWQKCQEGGPGVNVGPLVVSQDTTLPGPGHIRVFSSTKYSDDLGLNWTQMAGVIPGEPNSIQYLALHIPNSNVYIGYRNDGPCVTFDGIDGTFDLCVDGLASLTIYNVAQRPDQLDRVYLATASGIAYTTQYTGTSIDNAEKWKPPYGYFPIQPDLGMTMHSITISPYDSLLIIAGSGNGFYRATDGGYKENSYSSIDFDQVTGLDVNQFKGNGGRPVDITFYSADTVFAALKTDRSTYGGVAQSFDGGQTWSMNTSLPLFATSCVHVAYDSTSGAKVIYVGTGISDLKGRMYRSRDAGISWDTIIGPDAVNSNREELPVRDIKSRPGSTDTIYLACGDNTDWAIAWSYDGGTTLKTVTQTAGGAEVSRVTINKYHPDSIYFAQRNSILLLDFTEQTDTNGIVDTIEAHLFQYLDGLPGEIFYDLHYDELTLTSSIGFFGIKTDIITPIITDVNPVSAVPYLSLNGVYRNNRLIGLQYAIERKSHVTLGIYNLLGRSVLNLVNDVLPAGTYYRSIADENIATGAYISKLTAGKRAVSHKITLIK